VFAGRGVFLFGKTTKDDGRKAKNTKGATETQRHGGRTEKTTKNTTKNTTRITETPSTHRDHRENKENKENRETRENRENNEDGHRDTETRRNAHGEDSAIKNGIAKIATLAKSHEGYEGQTFFWFSL
jgi:hypothetical protein